VNLKKLLPALLLFNSVAYSQVESLPNSYKVVGIDTVWQYGYKGSGVRVAVIDNGFDLNHKDLEGRFWKASNFYDLTSNVKWAGHGTGMASIIGAKAGNGGVVGVAPESHLWLAQIGAGQYSPLMSTAAFNLALNWASSWSASVINASLGYAYDDNFIKSARYDTKTNTYIVDQSLLRTVTKTDSLAVATGRNSIIVISAGNQSLPYASFPAQFASRLDIYGNLILGGKMLVVGSVSDDGTISTFSNRAGHICSMPVANTCLDLVKTTDFFVVAPGNKIPQAQALGNSTIYGSGTSESAALVTGGIALLRQAWPQLRSEQLVKLVLSTTKDLGAPGTDNIYGRGMVDFANAAKSQGIIKLASANMKLGSDIPQPSNVINNIDGTKLLGQGNFTSLLVSSNILKTAQVIDSYDRNYTADFTRAIAKLPVVYNPDSPWLSFSSMIKLPIDKNKDLTIHKSYNGLATELNIYQHNWFYNLQVGNQQDFNGYLGNSGYGSLSLGSSYTNWMMLGIERKLTDTTNLVANYGQGMTDILNSTYSMIYTEPGLRSATWSVGLKSNNIFYEQDVLQLKIANPVHIVKGYAQITAVTGYTYEEDAEGNFTASPVIGKERINLAQNNIKPILSLSYKRSLSHVSNIGISWSGSSDSYKMGLFYNYIFK